MSPAGSAKTPPPEERLLRLIRGKSLEVPITVPAGAVPRPSGGLPRLGAGWASRWPQWLGGLLGVILTVEVGWLIFQIIRPLPSVDLGALTAVPGSGSASPGQPPQVPALSTQLAGPLFTAASEPAATEAGPQAAAPSAVANALAARLNLMGIVSGDPPQAIIEDSQTKKTYFVVKGQSVVDGAMVREVTENRVVLELQGETIELSL